MKRILRALLLAAAAVPAAAQEPVPLTPEAAARVAEFYNRPATTRVSGATRIAAGAELLGPVAVLGGPLVVAGRVAGDVLVINGDLRLEPGGRITGDVVVVGGRVADGGGAVGGTVTVYREALRFRREGDGIVILGQARPSLLSAGSATWFGRADLLLTIDGSYNRVEGLPITAGSRLELGGANPTVMEARLIWRTRNGLEIHPDDFGHVVGVEQYLGGHRAIAVGLGLHRVIDPIETRGLSDTENSLTTFVMHRDYRDHYGRRGWNAHIRFLGRTRPFEVAVQYRDEIHGSVPSANPWSLLDNDQEWRPQPQIAEGELRSVRGVFRWDSRNDRVDPSVGWLAEVMVEQGVEGELSYQVPAFGIPERPPVVTDREAEAEFTTLRVDLRRYLRLGPRTRIALRLAGAGSPDDGALPPQRQHVLGGEGSLPGYERLSLDCGAREAALLPDGYLPYYGCDRMVLAQGELRFALLAGESLGRRLGLDFDFLTSPELVLFGDAGRAWIEEESLGARLRYGPPSLRYDAGVGLRLGRIGLYLAVPLSEGGDGPNFFVRLGPRL